MAFRKLENYIRPLFLHEKQPGLLSLQLYIINKISGNQSVVVASTSPNNHLELNDDYPKILRDLKLAQYFHTLVRLVQSILLKLRSTANELLDLDYCAKEYKRTIMGFRDVRIYIGAVN